MAENVYEVIKSHYPELAKTLDTNEDLCKFLMLVYAHLLDHVADSTRDPRQLRLPINIVKERLLTITMEYSTEIVSGSSFSASKNPVQRNMRLAQFMQVNTDVKTLALRVTEMMERWMHAKDYRMACGFPNIRCEAQRMWKNGVFTTELVLKTHFDEAVRERMGWNEPEQMTEEESRIIQP